MSSGSTFWRDPALALVEARSVADGRQVCYSRHSHEGFSIGAITAGCSTYFDGQHWHEVEAGSVVMLTMVWREGDMATFKSGTEAEARLVEICS